MAETREARIAAAKEAVVKAAIPVIEDARARCVGSPTMTPVAWRWLNELDAAAKALAEAERPERPRLMTPTDAVLAQLSRDGGIWTHVPSGLSGGIAVSVVARRDDEIGEAIRKLPRYWARHPFGPGGLIIEPIEKARETVALADVIDLLEGR